MSPEKHLQDWQESQTIAETISPLLGQLYREKGVEVLLFGKTLVNAATIDIIKTHRLARRYTGTPLSADQTLPLIKALSEMELSPCRIDVGQLAHQFWQALLRLLLLYRMYLVVSFCIAFVSDFLSLTETRKCVCVLLAK